MTIMSTRAVLVVEDGFTPMVCLFCNYNGINYCCYPTQDRIYGFLENTRKIFRFRNLLGKNTATRSCFSDTSIVGCGCECDVQLIVGRLGAEAIWMWLAFTD